MTWAATAIAVGTATVGAVSANQERKAQQKANQANANISAAQAQYSPWTKITPTTPNIQATPDKTFGAAAQGALGGAMFANRLGAGKTTPETDMKLDAEDQAFLNDQPAAKPLGATSPMDYSPATNQFDREDDLKKFQEMEMFGKGPMKKRSAWG
jgi:hypothetical protein